MRNIKYVLLFFGLLFSIFSFGSTGSDYVGNLLNMSNIDDVVDNGIEQVIKIAIAVAVVVFLLSFGFGYLSSGVGALLNREGAGGGGTFFKAENLFYSLFIFIIIAAYSSIAGVIDQSVNYINTLSEIPTADIQNLANNTKYKDKKIEALIYYAKHGKDPVRKKAAIHMLDQLGVNEDDFINNMNKTTSSEFLSEESFMAKIAYFLDPRNLPTIIFGAMGKLIMGIVRGVVFMFTYFYFKLLLILGPLAFAFSINPKFKDLIYDWLGAVLSTGLVFTTMNLIDYFHSAVMQMRMAESNATQNIAVQSSAEILFNISFILLYASAFKITKTFVPGKGLGAGLVGKAIGLGAAALSGAALMAGGTATGGTDGGRMMKNLADVGKKATSAFKDND